MYIFCKNQKLNEQLNTYHGLYYSGVPNKTITNCQITNKIFNFDILNYAFQLMSIAVSKPIHNIINLN